MVSLDCKSNETRTGLFGIFALCPLEPTSSTRWEKRRCAREDALETIPERAHQALRGAAWTCLRAELGMAPRAEL